MYGFDLDTGALTQLSNTSNPRNRDAEDLWPHRSAESVNGVFYYKGYDSDGNDHLYRVDGSTVKQVSALNPGAGDDISWNMGSFNHQIYFMGGGILYRADSSDQVTPVLDQAQSGYSIYQLYSVASRLFFLGSDASSGNSGLYEILSDDSVNRISNIAVNDVLFSDSDLFLNGTDPGGSLMKSYHLVGQNLVQLPEMVPGGNDQIQTGVPGEEQGRLQSSDSATYFLGMTPKGDLRAFSMNSYGSTALISSAAKFAISSAGFVKMGGKFFGIARDLSDPAKLTLQKLYLFDESKKSAEQVSDLVPGSDDNFTRLLPGSRFVLAVSNDQTPYLYDSSGQEIQPSGSDLYRINESTCVSLGEAFSCNGERLSDSLRVMLLISDQGVKETEGFEPWPKQLPILVGEAKTPPPPVTPATSGKFLYTIGQDMNGEIHLFRTDTDSGVSTQLSKISNPGKRDTDDLWLHRSAEILDGVFYYRGFDENGFSHVYREDGDSVKQVSSINQNEKEDAIQQMKAFKHRLYFIADGSLYRTDSSDVVTLIADRGSTGYQVSEIAVTDTGFFFSGYDGSTGSYLYQVADDDTIASVSNFQINSLFSSGTALFTTARENSSSPFKLFIYRNGKFDQLTDIYPGSDTWLSPATWDNDNLLQSMGSNVVFLAYDGAYAPYQVDPSNHLTPLLSAAGFSNINQFVAFQGKLYAQGLNPALNASNKLYRFDESAGTATQISDFNPGQDDGIRKLTAGSNYLMVPLDTGGALYDGSGTQYLPDGLDQYTQINHCTPAGDSFYCVAHEINAPAWDQRVMLKVTTAGVSVLDGLTPWEKQSPILIER
ncbi:MAG: hypothetical protein EBX52_08790 [Proteobacteria bacterium]|nr:hypothetical protein [Pseudomonadota bacterium]